MGRISLLKENEIDKFNLPIELSIEQKKTAFTTIYIKTSNLTFRKVSSKVGFIIQSGYFLMNKKFFTPNEFHQSDVEFVRNLLKIKYDVDINEYKSSTLNIHKKMILDQYKYSSYSNNSKLFIKESDSLVKTSLKPKEILFTLIDFLEERKIEQPRYYVFAETISNSLRIFEIDLKDKLNDILTNNQKELLDDLFITTMDSEKETKPKNPYLITNLKKPIQAISPKKINESLADFGIIKELYIKFNESIISIGITNDLLNYYAVWVIKAEHIQFENITSKSLKRLFLISFIIYQFRLRQDYFVDTLLQCIPKYYNETNNIISKDFINSNEKQFSKRKGAISNIISVTKSAKEQIEQVKNILFSSDFPEENIPNQLRKIFSNAGKSYQEIALEELAKIDSYNIKHLKDQMFYGQLSNGYRKIQNRVSGILTVLEFNPLTSEKLIMDAINYFQQKKGKIKENAPISFISSKELKWLIDKDGRMDLNLYKVIFFNEVSNHIKAGSLNLKTSNKYKSIDEYLILKENWDTKKKDYLVRSNIGWLENYDGFIDIMKEQLHNQYTETNENIKNNDYLKFDKDGKARVNTPKLEEKEPTGIIDILGENQVLSLDNILTQVDYVTNFSEKFLHFSKKTSKNNISKDILYASIVGLGCNIGIRKMGKISKGVNSDRLEYFVRWHFSKENLDEANSRILYLINNLSLSKLYMSNKNKLHTSSDGQKFNVSVPSMNARYSYKYFGFGKGVAAYSFIDEQSKLFYNTIISTSEREAGYVLDGLMHNDDIDSTIHSTDTHGYSEIIFGICNTLGIFFAPRIKNHKNQLLYTFKSNSIKKYQNQNFKILPGKSLYIDEIILKEQWDQILRLLCSIKLKETKASEILRRLSSYSKQHPLYKSLKELGRIYKSIFMLRYLNEKPLRQQIEKQLNKVEHSHSFAKAIFFGRNQEFKVGTKEDQEVALSSRHLIQNAIILWNYLFVTEKLKLIDDKKEFNDLIESLKTSSMMTWQHINMLGEYDFDLSSNEHSFDIQSLLDFNIEKFI